jgi:hypothetical protein
MTVLLPVGMAAQRLKELGVQYSGGACRDAINRGRQRGWFDHLAADGEPPIACLLGGRGSKLPTDAERPAKIIADRHTGES